jgi:hypothetical protein
MSFNKTNQPGGGNHLNSNISNCLQVPAILARPFLFNTASTSYDSQPLPQTLNTPPFLTTVTDVGICVDMKNVHLDCDFHCSNAMQASKYPSTTNTNNQMMLPSFLTESHSSPAIYVPEFKHFIPNSLEAPFLYALPPNVHIAQEHEDYYAANAIVPKYTVAKALNDHQLLLTQSRSLPASTTLLYTTENLNNRNLEDHSTTAGGYNNYRTGESTKYHYDNHAAALSFDNNRRLKNSMASPKRKKETVTKPSMKSVVATMNPTETIDLCGDNAASGSGEQHMKNLPVLAVPKKKWLHRHYYNGEYCSNFEKKYFLIHLHLTYPSNCNLLCPLNTSYE